MIKTEFISLYEELSSLNEWVDSNGNRLTLTTNGSSTNSSVVYAWSLWTGSSTYGKGYWLSAGYENGALEGEVFSTEQSAIDAGRLLLWELYDDAELASHPDNFYIDVVEYPKSDLNSKVKLIK